jgi:hypothetical protein
MVKLKFGNFEIQAPSTRDVIVLLDKWTQYEKIREIKNSDLLLSCLSCGSYDISSIAPSIVQCNVCGIEMEEEYIYEEATFESDFDDEIE